MLVEAQLIENAKDNSEIERRLRDLTGRPQLEVVSIRKLPDSPGKIRAYEVDIR